MAKVVTPSAPNVVPNNANSARGLPIGSVRPSHGTQVVAVDEPAGGGTTIGRTSPTIPN